MKRAKSFELIVLAILMIWAMTACGNGSTDGGSDGSTGIPNTDWYNGGPGPFTISSADDLAGLAQLVNDGTDNFDGKTINLAVNLDLSAYQGGKGWTPIGNSYDNPFSGAFDGNNKTISGLFIDNDAADMFGLFGTVIGGLIVNLGVVDASISCINGGGGLLAGTGLIITINNCYATGSINGWASIGGLFGGGVLATINHSRAAVEVSAAENSSGLAMIAGGLAGVLTSGTISNCCATGAVSGDSAVGGLVGMLAQSSSIVDSYATGAVEGRYDSVGGLFGSSNEAYNVIRCYATGRVGGRDDVGGLAGYANLNSMSDCAALNPGIYRTGAPTYDNFGEIAGSVSSGTYLTNNIAYYPMNPPYGAVGEMGAHYSLSEIKDQATYTNDLHWPFGSSAFSPWKWGGEVYPLPVLYWQDEASYPVLPEY